MFEVDIERIYNYHARTDDLLAAPAEMFWEKIVEILLSGQYCLCTSRATVLTIN
jgi:hypothetical protein